MTDLLIVLATSVLLAGVLLSMLAHSKAKSSLNNCFSKLKQIGLGFRIWSNDNGDKFPWAVSAFDGGTREDTAATQVSPHFQIASNELSAPKVLFCERDIARTRRADWNLLIVPT
jgi:hypothetical protein